MTRSMIRTIAPQFTAAVVGIVATAIVMGGGFALAQEAPETGAAIAEVAAANSVDSAAIINGSVAGVDIASQTIGRVDIKPGVAPLWAKVDADAGAATLQSGRGVTGVTWLSPGFYRVSFSRTIVGCGWTATLNDNDAGSSLPGEISVERNSVGDAFSLRVVTYNSAGAPTAPADSDGFTVMVVC